MVLQKLLGIPTILKRGNTASQYMKQLELVTSGGATLQHPMLTHHHRSYSPICPAALLASVCLSERCAALCSCLLLQCFHFTFLGEAVIPLFYPPPLPAAQWRQKGRCSMLACLPRYHLHLICWLEEMIAFFFCIFFIGYRCLPL